MAASWRRNLFDLIQRDEDIPTISTAEQSKVEHDVLRIYRNLRDKRIGSDSVHLLRNEHLSYLNKGIKHLPYHFECLDASRPWLCYWIVHSMELLKQPIGEEMGSGVVQFLSQCQHPEGGFGGGPGQLPHLAPTYAAVLTLCTIGTHQAYNAIDRPRLQLFLRCMHQEDGSYVMHKDGEVDVRGAYCAIVAATLANVMCEELTHNTCQWIARCQTYEGGFSAVPGTEAHGGYTFCAFASLVLLNKVSLCNMEGVLRWATRRQMVLEGGFQGRTNKLVDGCYSFWVGGLFPLLHLAMKASSTGGNALDSHYWLFHQESLQEYILYCCQFVTGGLVDKPGKSRDYYHTCYCLSGLSIAQHCISKTVSITDNGSSLLEPIHPVFNISVTKAAQATEYFSKLPEISIVLT